MVTEQDTATIIRCHDLTEIPIPQFTAARKLELDKAFLKLGSAMLAAIPKRLKQVLCPGNDLATPGGIIHGVITNIRRFHHFQTLKRI